MYNVVTIHVVSICPQVLYVLYTLFLVVPWLSGVLSLAACLFLVFRLLHVSALSPSRKHCLHYMYDVVTIHVVSIPYKV